jgi:hypothetical protein
VQPYRRGDLDLPEGVWCHSGYGGAVYSRKGKLVARGCVFASQQTVSGVSGAAVAAFGSFEATDCKFTDNRGGE